MKDQKHEFSIQLPLKGIVQAVTELPDPVFAEKMMGDGIAIDPIDNVLHAPFAGKITQIHSSHHAVTLQQGDVELLMHIGLDSVALKGRGFELHVAEGDQVQAGQPLITFDADLIARECVSVQSAFIITSGQEIKPTVSFDGVQSDLAQTVFTVPSSNDPSAAPAPFESTANVDAEPAQYEVTGSVQIPNVTGLHARPAARLAVVVRQADAKVRFKANGNTCDGSSVTGIMSLKTKLGDLLEIEAAGDDAQQVTADIIAAIKAGLGEEVTAVTSFPEVELVKETPLLQVKSGDDGVLLGFTASPGRVIGKLVQHNKTLPEVTRKSIGLAEERAAFKASVKASVQDLQSIIERMTEQGQEELADVFNAHVQLLQDPELSEKPLADIAGGQSAAWSWKLAYEAQAETLAKMDDPLLAARAADVRDVGLRVLKKLLGVDDGTEVLQEGTILLQEDVTPSEVVALDLSKIVGLCTTHGGASSHAAIIARSNNLPYLVNVEEAIKDLEDGTPLLLDAKHGKIKVSPSAEEQTAFALKIENASKQAEEYRRDAHKPAITTDGVRVEIAANIGSLEDAEKAVAAGAEAVGLLRSEFLYMERLNEPTEEEQADIIGNILEVMGKDRPVIIRTLDVGGDKPLPYMPMPAEENPFLGVRGVRIGIERPSILRRQVRAIISQAHKGHARIMYPMISALDELRAVNALVREEQKNLGVEHVEVGIMIEVPSAALMADKLAEEVDFFSIGTNDLTQYVMAIDRGHPALASRADALHPAVLRMIDMTVKAAEKAGKWVGVCGGLASQPEAVPILIGLGVKELSVSVPALPEIKHKVRTVSMADSISIAKAALECADTSDVKNLLRSQ
ncbi:phosphoenolpyruvate--protein phosphotransferase [Pseudovibrio sp. Tun.PSC04-5.I4]|uniref:phosphoenolpyruvate--protein phosphotransferase n=1 Tax=Pseudovibrio sp. Tun.PSC04-5.I4 TaxID=1798213 RepID=UPI00088606F6|nr:phosphoenolpyruvate--protein phosphotransferase [Pseudovibrio sp. Tun.PSC04-5.I4]SDR47594.1 Phosphocarrier protein HPr /phosphoenolpyruvate--protein phosphotransferase /PTS system IIA component, Glc family [Pseudovibrio sp. Tun.PSC04-5.I4]